jgi:hypothetical protein
MKSVVQILATALLASTSFATAAGAAEAIGSTEHIAARAYGTVPGQSTEPLYLHDPVHVDERIETSRKGGARLEFDDRTEMWIGEESEVVLDEFIYDPNTNAGTFVAELGGGLFRFVTGEIASEGFEVKTPVATIGVRGTDFSVMVAGSGAITASCYHGGICIKPLRGRTVCIEAGETATVATADGIVSVNDTPLATPPASVASPAAGNGSTGAGPGEGSGAPSPENGGGDGGGGTGSSQ